MNLPQYDKGQHKAEIYLRSDLPFVSGNEDSKSLKFSQPSDTKMPLL